MSKQRKNLRAGHMGGGGSQTKVEHGDYIGKRLSARFIKKPEAVSGMSAAKILQVILAAMVALFGLGQIGKCLTL